ncbi:MAG TPA: hypothetical protein PLZ43_11520 [bacterium]|nr:hypothetical protein [bacterium]
MSKKFLMLILFSLIFAVSCSKDKNENIYPVSDKDVFTTDKDSDSTILPDESYDPDIIVNDPDNSLPDDEKADNDGDSEQPDIAEIDNDISDMDADEVADTDIPEMCFEKICVSHDECSIENGICGGFVENEEYVCSPDITDFGYQGGGTCAEVNCSVDSDCREDLGYICVLFGLSSPDFNDAESVCAKSVIGEACSEEGKKICQFGKNIAIECIEGFWVPDYCEDGFVCENGDCIPEESDSDENPDADSVVAVEICDNIDNNGVDGIDEGCDKDGDGWCDINMTVYGSPAVCPNGTLDCNDGNSSIYPGSKIHSEGVDYDCDNRKEYQAVMVLSVDDELVELCANGRQFDKATEFGANYNRWPYADSYTGEKLILESGINVIGVHGKDTGLAISAFVGTISVNGQLIVSDGVLPPSDGQPYIPGDPEWTAAQWRYFPEAVPTPNADWCDKWFDDSDWGPAIKAGKTGTASTVWGNLGTNPWYGGACGLSQSGRCPTVFESYYVDGTIGNEPKWIWDYNPTQLADAWLRIKITLP